MDELTPKEMKMISRIRAMRFDGSRDWQTPFNIILMVIAVGLWAYGLFLKDTNLPLSGLLLFIIASSSLEKCRLYKIIQKTSANNLIEAGNAETVTIQRNKAIVMVVMAVVIVYGVWKTLM